MAVRDGRGDVRQTTTGFRDPRHPRGQSRNPRKIEIINDSKSNSRKRIEKS